MSTTEKAYTLEAYDKVTPATVYTRDTVLQGEIVTREQVRVSTWLRTPGLGEFVSIYHGSAIVFPGAGSPRIVRFAEHHLPLGAVVAMHITPPETDPVDYDPTEQNRKMMPATALVGPFRIDGSLRVPSHMTLARLLENMRETVIPIYDAVVACAEPSVPPVRVTMTLVRPSACAFAAGPA